MSSPPPLARHLTVQWRTEYHRALLDWFEQHQRDLPWRRTRDPYAIWISESMLQQTQVATVISYFNRFMQRFPNVQSLAAASEQEVLSMWAGLGYYRRARQLHAAAQQIVAEHGGQFPSELSAILDLPGIGRYTAGAIASIALGKPAPIVEANTERLYARLMKLDKPVRDPLSVQLLWRFAQWQLEGTSQKAKSTEKRGPGSINQAAMELGALICKPVEPLCLVCPLSQLCPTHKQGLQQRIPVPKPKREFTKLHHVALMVQYRGRWLLRLNPPGGWWHGLWDFPRIDVTELRLHDHTQFQPRTRTLPNWDAGTQNKILQLAHQQLFGDKPRTVFTAMRQPLLSLSHGVTRYRIVLDGVAADVDKAFFKTNDQWKWTDAHSDLPLTATAKKMLARMGSREGEAPAEPC